MGIFNNLFKDSEEHDYHQEGPAPDGQDQTGSPAPAAPSVDGVLPPGVSPQPAPASHNLSSQSSPSPAPAQPTDDDSSSQYIMTDQANEWAAPAPEQAATEPVIEAEPAQEETSTESPAPSEPVNPPEAQPESEPQTEPEPEPAPEPAVEVPSTEETTPEESTNSSEESDNNTPDPVNENQQDEPAPSEPISVNVDPPEETPEAEVDTSFEATEPDSTPSEQPAGMGGDDDNTDLDSIKQQALDSLSPLVDHLEQSPEDKFLTAMMLLQSSENTDMVKKAYEAAQAITDDKTRAQALLDVVHEINYLSQKDK